MRVCAYKCMYVHIKELGENLKLGGANNQWKKTAV